MRWKIQSKAIIRETPPTIKKNATSKEHACCLNSLKTNRKSLQKRWM
jgi:hypothetical protein